jgi:hypothetical protein
MRTTALRCLQTTALRNQPEKTERVDAKESRIMDKKNNSAAIALTLATLTFACSGAPPTVGAGTGSNATGNTELQSADVVHETVVRVNADGTQNVRQIDVPRQVVLGQVALRRQLASKRSTGLPSETPATAVQPVPSTNGGGEATGTVSQATQVDTGCAYTDLWLYDTRGACEGTFSGYLLCYNAVDGTGTGPYPYTLTWPGNNVNSWYHEVKEYSPGNESGQITWDVDNHPGQECYTSFTAPTNSYGCFYPDVCNNGGVGCGEIWMQQ